MKYVYLVCFVLTIAIILTNVQKHKVDTFKQDCELRAVRFHDSYECVDRSIFR